MKEKLRELLENSYAPLSHYHVAAILECKDGTLFKGVNIETSSPAAGICAERNALYSALAEGYKKDDFVALYIMNKTEKPCYPCFICRQALNDFLNDNTQIIAYGYTNKEERVIENDLDPYPFSEENMK